MSQPISFFLILYWRPEYLEFTWHLQVKVFVCVLLRGDLELVSVVVAYIFYSQKSKSYPGTDTHEH